MKPRKSYLALIGIVGCLILAGCGTESAYEETASEAASTNEYASITPEEKAAAIASNLKAADVVDGAEDHVVSKCSSCALRMDGSAEHALQVADYELQFCSLDCKEHFAEDAEGSVLALKIPE